ncbi:MAG: hypothetical protein ACO2OS_08150 [Thermosphaera aggregans]|jgi:hypothetical protein|uniref:hypothetical protein n=1 Tax=Thermosphaera aggregans TaxID=54254 RepID=UPI003C025F43
MAVGRVYRFYVRSILSDGYMWFWAVAFMAFWLFMGAYVYGAGTTIEEFSKQFPEGTPGTIINEAWSKFTLHYTAGWYGSIALFSMSSVTIGLVYYIFYSTIPIRYLTKYSKATTAKFYTGFTLAAITGVVVCTIVLLVTTILLYSYRFYGAELKDYHGLPVPVFKNLVLPENPVGVLATTIAGGVLMYFIGATVALLVIVLKKPRALGLASFLPHILSFGLGMAGLIATGGKVHFSPYNTILLLNYHYYANATLVLDEPVTMMWRSGLEGAGQVLEPSTLWLALLGWILLFAAASVVLFKKQRGVNVEQILSL